MEATGRGQQGLGITRVQQETQRQDPRAIFLKWVALVDQTARKKLARLIKKKFPEGVLLNFRSSSDSSTVQRKVRNHI